VDPTNYLLQVRYTGINELVLLETSIDCWLSWQRRALEGNEAYGLVGALHIGNTSFVDVTIQLILMEMGGRVRKAHVVVRWWIVDMIKKTLSHTQHWVKGYGNRCNGSVLMYAAQSINGYHFSCIGFYVRCSHISNHNFVRTPNCDLTVLFRCSWWFIISVWLFGVIVLQEHLKLSIVADASPHRLLQHTSPKCNDKQYVSKKHQ